MKIPEMEKFDFTLSLETIIQTAFLVCIKKIKNSGDEMTDLFKFHVILFVRNSKVEYIGTKPFDENFTYFRPVPSSFLNPLHLMIAHNDPEMVKFVHEKVESVIVNYLDEYEKFSIFTKHVAVHGDGFMFHFDISTINPFKK